MEFQVLPTDDGNKPRFFKLHTKRSTYDCQLRIDTASRYPRLTLPHVGASRTFTWCGLEASFSDAQEYLISLQLSRRHIFYLCFSDVGASSAVPSRGREQTLPGRYALKTSCIPSICRYALPMPLPSRTQDVSRLMSLTVKAVVRTSSRRTGIRPGHCILFLFAYSSALCTPIFLHAG